MSIAIRLDDIIKILEPDDKTLQSIMTLPWIEVPDECFINIWELVQSAYKELSDSFINLLFLKLKIVS